MVASSSADRPRILDVLDLEKIDGDIFRGRVITATLRRTFGGKVAAQCLVAATRTVGAEYEVHSLHGYFVAPGRSEEPTLYIVERIRDGRSCCSRQVKAVQHGKPIFIMQASFHVRTDEGPEHSDAMRRGAPPGEGVVKRDGLRPGRQAL